MGLSSEGFRTQGRTMLAIFLIKIPDGLKPSPGEVESAQRAIEAAGNRLPIFPVRWKGGVHEGAEGVFYATEHLATLSAADKLGFEYVACDVEGGGEEFEGNVQLFIEEEEG